jgi:pSer/pThr/pTyr-binding forkhead associated (FHA) protein
MQGKVKLTVSYYGGKSQEVRVESKRFTVGRSIDDDLFIDDPALSRRHALIEIADGAVLV